MTDYVVEIARDFSEYPTGRYKKHGEGSGEQFREEFLLPHLKNGECVAVKLDGTSGYPSSFLEEAFGGLIRLGFSLADLKSQLNLIAEKPSYEPYKLLAWDYIEKAARLAATADAR